MRTALALLVVVGLTGSLAACSTSTSDPDASGAASDTCVAAPSGTGSDGVKVTGDFGAEPTVDISSPLTVDATERTVVIEGDGDVVTEGQKAQIDFALYNATSGEQVSSTGYTEDSVQTLSVDESQVLPGIAKTIECSTIGSRVVGVIPPVDSWGETGSTDLGIAATDTIVFVADVVSVSPPALDRADGEDQEPVEGLPTVVLDDDGAPTITIPDADAPTELEIAALKVGDGDVVADGDTVTVNYTGVIWDTGEVFDSSWANGAPVSFATTGVITGFGKALVGQTVGSQVIAVIPPDEGYGEAGSGTIKGTDTIVFVVDILGID